MIGVHLALELATAAPVKPSSLSANHPPCAQRFTQMVRRRKIEHGMRREDHHLFVLAEEDPGERIVRHFGDDTISDPLPELRLRSPELFTVTAYH